MNNYIPHEDTDTKGISTTGSVMTIGRITHETKARAIGVMSEGGPKQSLHAKSTKISTKSKSVNKTLFSLEFVKNLIMDIYNRHVNSAEDIV